MYGVSGIYNEVVNVILLSQSTSSNALVAKYLQVYNDVVTLLGYLATGDLPQAMLLGVSIFSTVKDFYNDFSIYLPECYRLFLRAIGQYEEQ